MDYQVILPAIWKDALVNNDWDLLEKNHPDEAAEAKAWQIQSELTVIGCDEKAFIATFEAIQIACLKYHCVYPVNDDLLDSVLKKIEQGTTTFNDAVFVRCYVAEIKKAICGAKQL